MFCNNILQYVYIIMLPNENVSYSSSSPIQGDGKNTLYAFANVILQTLWLSRYFLAEADNFLAPASNYHAVMFLSALCDALHTFREEERKMFREKLMKEGEVYVNIYIGHIELWSFNQGDIS